MNVHDQPSCARHEEPLRAAARSRREAQAPLARRAASPRDARADNVPGWHARVLRFWGPATLALRWASGTSHPAGGTTPGAR